jgi:glycine cleavage system H lipoate-binding protein/NAD-dependent dihydropyrimidine dehydrogenase PreA subunit/ferredoxin
LKETAMISLTVDGEQVSVERGQTVLDAVRKAGIDIPTLCYSEHLLPFGACRLCTVEVGRDEKFRLQASCACPAEEGLEVKTGTDRVVQGRKVMAELLLNRCPDVEAVKELAAGLGVDSTRFKAKNETCVLCGQCVKICSEVVGAGAISFSGRGILKKVEPPFDKHSDRCLACGACTFVCPTGHIQMEFETRRHWQETLPPEARDCRYARMGYFSHKICPNDFRCELCEVDQRMEDFFETHPAVAVSPASLDRPKNIAGFDLVPALHYSQGHVWAAFMNGVVRLGIDDFARAVLHRVEDVRVPAPGAALGSGEVLWELESGGKVLPMVTPLAGRVISVNPHLEVDPQLVSREPYRRGWIALVEPASRSVLEACRSRLVTGRAAELWLGEEAEKLHAWKDSAVAEEGRLVENPPARLDAVQWRALVAEFFGKRAPSM